MSKKHCLLNGRADQLVNNLRALKVGLRMIWGLTFGWRAFA
jgi:hypothetical protein